jgi:hypothetical protein
MPCVSSRDLVYVYDALKRMALAVTPFMLAVSCRVLDSRSELIWLTTPNRGASLEPVNEIAPLAGTIDVTGAKTGLSLSLARVNFGDVSRLMSRALVSATPLANEASSEKLYRSAKRLLNPSDPLQARGAPKSGLNTVMLRR